MPTKKPQEPSSDTSEESIPERPFFKLATRVKVTSTEPYTDAYSFDLGIRYVEDHGNIVLKGTFDLKPEMIVQVSSLSFYGEEVGRFDGNITNPPFRFEHDIDLENVKGLVRFFIDQTESLVFGIDVKRSDGKHLRTMKRVAYIHQESTIF